jgi:SAM-dependent methyltransferase
MSGFSPEWLALREPVDHRSRDPKLAARVVQHLAANSESRIVDLGCGTGSNLRALAPQLGPRQSWTLVDYDARLLTAARDRLLAWADGTTDCRVGVILHKNDREIAVRFRQADLVRDLDAALGEAADLITASALFDLCSTQFIERFAEAVAARRAAFYTVLTYDGVQTWQPEHPADDAMRQAFIAHQKTDKGFGTSAGPDAPSSLASAFRTAGYTVEEADTPWRLGPADSSLIADLATGFAGAVEETGRIDAKTISDWHRVIRTAAVVGHIDTLALPPA